MSDTNVKLEQPLDIPQIEQEIGGDSIDDIGEIFSGVVKTDLSTLGLAISELGIDVDGKKVIEFGSGRGGPSFLFATKGASVTGIEPNSEVRSKAEASASELQLQNQVQFIGTEASALEAAFKNAGIVYSYPLEGEMTDELLKNIQNFCKPGTVIIINTFTNNFANRIKGLENGTVIGKGLNESDFEFTERLKKCEIKGYPNLKIRNFVTFKRDGGYQSSILLLEST